MANDPIQKATWDADQEGGIPLDFQRLSPEEQQATVNRMCDDIEQNYDIVYVKDEFGLEHPTFVPKQGK